MYKQTYQNLKATVDPFLVHLSTQKNDNYIDNKINKNGSYLINYEKNKKLYNRA